MYFGVRVNPGRYDNLDYDNDNDDEDGTAADAGSKKKTGPRETRGPVVL